MTVMRSAVAKTIDDLRERGGLKGVVVANVTDVSKATVSLWSAGKAAPQPRTQLLLSDLRYVVDRLSEFYTPDETRTWLYSRNALLNGERAMDLIHEGRTEEVLPRSSAWPPSAIYRNCAPDAPSARSRPSGRARELRFGAVLRRGLAHQLGEPGSADRQHGGRPVASGEFVRGAIHQRRKRWLAR
jgi:hypothetical protein